MSSLLQRSDTHFGTERSAVVEALTALASQQRPDLVVLSGDITQRARPVQFRAARALTDRLGLCRCWRCRATTTYLCSVCGRACAAPTHGTWRLSVPISNPCTARPS